MPVAKTLASFHFAKPWRQRGTGLHQVAHRIHVPLLTNPGVEFLVGTERIDTQPQYAFELNNKMAHAVANRGATARIHLIFDYAPN